MILTKLVLDNDAKNLSRSASARKYRGNTKNVEPIETNNQA